MTSMGDVWLATQIPPFLGLFSLEKFREENEVNLCTANRAKPKRRKLLYFQKHNRVTQLNIKKQCSVLQGVIAVIGKKNNRVRGWNAKKKKRFHKLSRHIVLIRDVLILYFHFGDCTYTLALDTGWYRCQSDIACGKWYILSSAER